MQKYKVFEHSQYRSVSTNVAQSNVESVAIKSIREMPQSHLFALLRRMDDTSYLEVYIPEMVVDNIKISAFIAQINKRDIENIYFN